LTSDDLLEAKGTIRWPIAVTLPDFSGRQEGITVKSTARTLPISLQMDGDDLRSLAASGAEGYVFVDLCLRVSVDEGKEVVRDQAGRMEGVKPRRFATIEWDDYAQAA
jgi:hypothetical protein